MKEIDNDGGVLTRCISPWELFEQPLGAECSSSLSAVVQAGSKMPRVEKI